MGCQKKDGCVNLSSYHELHVVGSRIQVITDSSGSYFLGPKIYAIENVNGFAFGINSEVLDSEKSNKYENIPGFFILQPNGESHIGLTKKEFESFTEKFGFSDIKLDKAPSSLLDWDNLQACDSARIGSG